MWRMVSVGALSLVACMVREAPPINAGYFPTTTISGRIGQPSPYVVESMPPDPLYEPITPSPGAGYSWIDGSWHWDGTKWVWVEGRWEREQVGYVYVSPSYDFSNNTYIYTPGYWCPPESAPRGTIVRDQRDGRPTLVTPTPGGGRPPSTVLTQPPQPTGPVIPNAPRPLDRVPPPPPTAPPIAPPPPPPPRQTAVPPGEAPTAVPVGEPLPPGAQLPTQPPPPLQPGAPPRTAEPRVRRPPPRVPPLRPQPPKSPPTPNAPPLRPAPPSSPKHAR